MQACGLGWQGNPESQRVEVRGWIVSDPKYADPDGHHATQNADGSLAHLYPAAQELTFDLELDHGWLPIANDVTPFTSPGAVDQAVTPVNFSSLFNQELVPDPGPGSSGGNYYGGRDPTIHVEVDAWDPLGRECREVEPYSSFPPPLDKICRREGPPPVPVGAQATDWVPKPATLDEWGLDHTALPPDSPWNSTLYWPFDPNAPQLTVAGIPRHSLRVGDYVRLVGTIWEDHNLPGHPPNPGGECWKSGFTEHRGWIEMHPVDLLAVVYPPGTTVVYPPGTSHIPAATTTSSAADLMWWITACGGASLVKTLYAPARPAPADDYQVGCQWWIDGDFTVKKKIADYTVTATSNGVIVTLKQAGDLSAQAKFEGVYDVYWERKGGPGCVEIHPAIPVVRRAPALQAGSPLTLAESLRLPGRSLFLPFAPASARPSPPWAGTPLTVKPPDPAKEEREFPIKTYHLVAGRWTP